MAKKIDLSKHSLEELKALKSDVESAIAEFAERRRAEARKAIEAVAKEHGMSLEDIVGGKAKRRKAKAPAKYANPENASETWSGRGRQPAWYKKALASGKSQESLEV